MDAEQMELLERLARLREQAIPADDEFAPLKQEVLSAALLYSNTRGRSKTWTNPSIIRRNNFV